MTTSIYICLGIFAVMILGYALGDKIGLSSGAVALLVITLTAFSGIVKPASVIANFGNTNVVLICCMYVISQGFNRTQAVHKLSGLVYKVSGGSFNKMLTGYILITFVLCQFIPSPIAVFTIISPLVANMCEECGVSPSKAMFPIVLVDVGTCIAFPVGAGATTFATMNGYLESYGYTDYQMSLLDPFKGRALCCVIILLFAIFVQPRLCPDQPSVEIVTRTAKKSDDVKPLDAVHEVLGYGVFILTTLALIFQTKLGYSSWQIALAGATVVVVSGVLTPAEATRAIPVRIALLIVAALSVGGAMVECGLGDMIGNTIASALGGTTNGYVVGAVFFLVPFIMTQFMQNGSVQNIFIPILILTCKSLGCNPIGPLILLQASTLTAFMTPSATPVIPVMMDAGGYNANDLIKMGWLPSLIIFVVSVAVVMTVFPAY